MAIGVFSYDDIFSKNIITIGDPPVFAYVLFLLFVVVMTILLMNLLVNRMNNFK